MSPNDTPPEWRYETSEDLNKTAIERLRSFPREPEMLVYAMRSAAALLVRAWLRIYHRLRIVGSENLPAEGSYVVVSNHSSHLDALCLLAMFPLGKLHRVFPAAAADYFFESLPRTAIAAIVVNALPFDRSAHVGQSLGLCRDLLDNPGNTLIIFPEGTRSTTGEVGRFRPGIGLLVAGTSTPVVPCYLDGAFRAWPKGKRIPRPRQIRVIIGKPRTFEGLAPDKSGALEIGEALRQAVVELQMARKA